MNATECPICGSRLARARVSYEHLGHQLGTYSGWRCTGCSEAFFGEKASADIERKSKQLGIWGLKRRTRVARAGNSLVVRIPAELARALSMRKGSEVELKPGGRQKLVLTVVG